MKTRKKSRSTIEVILFMAFLLFSLGSYAQSDEWVAPANVAKRPNPFKGDAKAPEKGKKIYEKLCVTCHGSSGKGDGPTAATLDPKPADHTSAEFQLQGDGAIYWKLSTGRGVMPAFQDLLSKTERWQLTAYIRSLGENND
ncbi:MAG: c-type cytochrome [Bacteroidia bacterium]|nr:c-type cytochrome [Bacteroidia bacterium]NND25888.1 cytochrome c [Flavobacteriaceae bacterium]MBT8277855.1 c-type cytochrome [Bacteroidia bacterium]NNK59062.1 cytochrome c [Flavobacteriaceae bacterium]NNL32511.1 cytochrome c [Flavobacteriaceae bacterium]